MEDGDGAVLDGFGVGTQYTLPHADQTEAVSAGARGQFCFEDGRLRSEVGRLEISINDDLCKSEKQRQIT